MKWVYEKVIVPVWDWIKEHIITRLQEAWDFIKSVLAILVAIAKSQWEQFKQNTITPIQQAWEMIKSVFGLIKSMIIEKLKSIVQDAIDWGGDMLEALVAPFRKAKEKIEEIANKIKDLAKKISPFHKESPSLVELVEKGVAQIKEAYASLGDMDFGSVAHNPALVGGVGTGTSVIQNINVYPQDELDVDAMIDRLGWKYRTSI
jgi:phage-related tail protein